MSLPAPSQPVAVDLAPERSCTLDVSGAYTFRANGIGNDTGCWVGAEGAELSIDPFTRGPDGELSISGPTWRSSCIAPTEVRAQEVGDEASVWSLVEHDARGAQATVAGGTPRR
jgi:hypothetical protein